MKVIMFHYVMPHFDYYHFDLNLFEEKINYLTTKYKVISLKEYSDLIEQKHLVNDNYVMLTFDDGTIDHYDYVYPILKKYNCSGLFFVSSCVFENRVLDIQLIHRLLALGRFDELYSDLMNEIELINFSMNDINYFETLDDNLVGKFKQLLQYLLPCEERQGILYKLCKKYKVSTDISDYYMSISQMQEMKNNNMFFGIHTNTHQRLSLLDYSSQKCEIVKNMKYLLEYNIINKDLMAIGFPFGLYNDDTLNICRKVGIKYGFKASTNIKKSLLEIDRIDCNILKENFYE